MGRGKLIHVEDVQIRTAAVEIKTLAVSGRQVEIAIPQSPNTL